MVKMVNPVRKCKKTPDLMWMQHENLFKKFILISFCKLFVSTKLWV